jgi:Protein of unknown function (DUF2924)
MSFQRFSEKFQRSPAISCLRDGTLQDFFLVVHGLPQVMLLAVDLHEYLDQVPSPTARPHALDPVLSDLGSEHRTETMPPEPHRLMTNADAPSGIAPTLALNDPALLTAATKVGMAFRTLFNQPETQALLRAEGDVYRRAVLRHAAEHDLQSVSDEYAHVLLKPMAKSVTHVVDVLPEGFLWDGIPHLSLSAIARAIAGARWSGPRFFGLVSAADATKGGQAAKGSPRKSAGLQRGRAV